MFFSNIIKNLILEISIRIQLLLKDGMGLRMKNFNVMGVHWKIRFLGPGAWKTNILAMKCLKRGAWAVCRFKSWFDKKEEVDVFDVRLRPQCTLWDGGAF